MRYVPLPRLSDKAEKAVDRYFAVVNAGRAQTNARMVLAMSGRGRKFKTKRLPGPMRPRLIIEGEPEILIKRMTNWQRHQWARAGYPRARDQVEMYIRAMRVDTPSARPTYRGGGLVTRWDRPVLGAGETGAP